MGPSPRRVADGEAPVTGALPVTRRHFTPTLRTRTPATRTSTDHSVVSAIDTVTGTSAVARVVDEAGTVDFATGWRLEEDLTWDTLYGPFHPKTRLHRDNRADFRTWDGAVVCRDQAGHPTAIELPDGSPLDVVRAVLQDDGTWVATRSNGDVHRYAPDGSFRVKSQSPAQGDALTAGSSAVFTEC